MDDIVAVVTDLFFQSRIDAAAKRSGRTVRFVASDQDFNDVRGCRLVLVDLDVRADVTNAMRTLKGRVSGPVIAFGPHLDGERLKAARAAGADRALARSKFVSELPRLLAGSDHIGRSRSVAVPEDELSG